MAKPVFFYAGAYDSLIDAEVGTERAAMRATRHVLRRAVDDRDEAAQEALMAIAQAAHAPA